MDSVNYILPCAATDSIFMTIHFRKKICNTFIYLVLLSKNLYFQTENNLNLTDSFLVAQAQNKLYFPGILA